MSASTQNQALAAFLFLYEKFSAETRLARGRRARQAPERLPVVSRAARSPPSSPRWMASRLCASLLYGAGLRLLEVLHLRVKDIDFAGQQLIVRDGKGSKDRVTLLPATLQPAFATHIDRRARLSTSSTFAPDGGFVELPDALRTKYPSAAKRVGLAVGLPRRPATTSTAPPASAAATTCTRPSSSAPSAAPPRRRHPEARQPPHPPPFLRHPPARSRLRHPHHPGAARPQGRQHHDDLHPRPAPRPPRRSKSLRTGLHDRRLRRSYWIRLTGTSQRRRVRVCRRAKRLIVLACPAFTFRLPLVRRPSRCLPKN